MSYGELKYLGKMVIASGTQTADQGLALGGGSRKGLLFVQGSMGTAINFAFDASVDGTNYYQLYMPIAQTASVQACAALFSGQAAGCMFHLSTGEHNVPYIRVRSTAASGNGVSFNVYAYS